MPALPDYGGFDLLLYLLGAPVPLLFEPDLPADFIEVLEYHPDHLLHIHIGNPSVASGLLLVSDPARLLVLHPLKANISKDECRGCNEVRLTFSRRMSHL